MQLAAAASRGRVKMYTHVTVKLKYGQLGAFFEMMPKVKAIVEDAGWKMLDAYYFLNGRINTMVHIWEMRDMNHYMEGVALLSAHPDFPALNAALGEACDEETIVFAEKAPYSP